MKHSLSLLEFLSVILPCMGVAVATFIACIPLACFIFKLSGLRGMSHYELAAYALEAYAKTPAKEKVILLGYDPKPNADGTTRGAT